MVRIFNFCFLIIIGMNLFAQNKKLGNKICTPFINLEDRKDIDISSEFIDKNSDYVPVFGDNYLNVNYVKVKQGSKLTDTVLIKEFLKAVVTIVCFDKSLFVEKVIVNYLGDIQFIQSISTKLLLFEINQDVENRHSILLGVNVFEKKAISIINLSEAIVNMGFGSLFYSNYNKNTFTLIIAPPSDIAGKIKEKRKKGVKIKMLYNGEFSW